MMSHNKILEIQNLSMEFGGLQALDSIDITFYEKEVVAIIGPNGAGKTTLFNCITGVYVPTRGNIFIQNPSTQMKEKINGLKPNIITRKGMARTFQNIRLFKNMTVLENVMIGRHCHAKAGIISAMVRSKKTRDEEARIIHDSRELLKKVNLVDEQYEYAKNLSYGYQKRLEIARALATKPFLLLLDEPAAGMNSKETAELMDLLKEIKKDLHIALLLIDHDMHFIMNLSEKIFVMDYGKKIAEGTPEEIQKNPLVIKAYLGENI